MAISCLRGAPLQDIRSVAALIAMVTAGICARASAETIDEPALLKQIGFSAQEIQRIGRGDIVARSIDADASTVALAVAGTIAVPPAFYLEKFRDIESFKKTQEVQQIGKFGRPPTAAEMSKLTLDQADLDALKTCRVGDCGVKLDARGIQATAGRHASVEAASAVFRPYLAGYTARYLQSGNNALIEYHDSATTTRMAGHLQEIRERTVPLRRWPALFDAVFNFHGTLPVGLEDFAYWSKEKVGPRTVVSVTHVIISPPRDGATAVATKQIYVSHYGNASLGVTLLLDKSTPELPRLRIVYTNRSRVDVFGGILGPIKRPLVRSRAREAAERMMRGLKERLEEQYSARLKAER